MKQKELTLQERASRFNWGKCFGYSFIRIAATANSLLATYVTYYCTNSLLLSGVMVGSMMAVVKLFDSFTDIIAGVILDKTRTKLGKARPYLLFGVVSWITLMIMFSTPNLSDIGKLIWVFITYSLNSCVFMTMYKITFNTLLKRIVLDDKGRTKTSSFAGFFMMIGATAVNAIVPSIISKAADVSAIWSKLAIIMGAIGSVLVLIGFFTCKEFTDEELSELNLIGQDEVNAELPKFMDMLKTMVSNKYFLLFLIHYAFTMLSNGLMQTAGTFFFDVNVGDLSILSKVTILTLVTYPLYLVYPRIIEKLGGAKVMQLGAAIGIVGIVIRMAAGANVPLIYVGTILLSVGSLASTILEPLIAIKCMDFGYLKTGVRAEGIYSSGMNCVYKIFFGASAALVGFILAMGHYDAALPTQPASALFSITFMYNIAPLIARVIDVILFGHFRLDQEIAELSREKG